MKTFIIGKRYAQRANSSDLVGFYFTPTRRTKNKIDWKIEYKNGKSKKGTSVVYKDKWGEYIKPRGFYPIFA